MRYLGVFFGDDKSNRDWLKYRTPKWEKNICLVTETVGKYPQEITAAVIRAIQSGWIFLQRVTKDMGQAFTGVEKLLRETFLPRLFFVKLKSLQPIVGILSTIPVKKVGLGLQDPVT